MPRRRLILLIAATALLGGCGAKPSPQQPEVASLSSAAPTRAGQQTTTATGTSEQGTRLRLDSTEQEQAKLLEDYRECLFQHGVKEKLNDPGRRPAPAGAGKRNLDESGEPKSAYAACAPKKPLPPVELDENANPNFAAQWEDNLRCLRAHGLKVHTTEPGSWTYDSSDVQTPDNQEQLERDCLQEAFGGKKN